MNIIGKNLKRLRQDRKMTQNTLAEISQVNQGTISNIELGKHIPGVASLTAIAEALHVSVASLDPRLLEVDANALELADDSLPYIAPSTDSLKRMVDERWDSLTPDQKIRIIEVMDEKK